MSIVIGLSHGYRSSGGGTNVNGGLLGGLEQQPDCTVVPFDPKGPVPTGCDVLVCTGTLAVRAKGSATILWPLNVAPLEPATVRLSAVTLAARARYRLLPVKLAASIRRSDALVFGSGYAADLYRARFPRARSLPFTVVRTGSPSLPLGPGQDAAPEPGRILMVAHLYPYKMVLEAIAAMAIVRRTVPTARLVIAGKPAEPTYAAAVAQAAQRTEGIDLLGLVDPAELTEQYRRADIALLTSVSENAGSFHMFDAALFGLPLVSSGRSSLGEVLSGTAEFVDPAVPQSIADGLLAVLTDPQRRAQLAQQSADFAAAAPSWADRAARLVEFARSVS